MKNLSKNVLNIYISIRIMTVSSLGKSKYKLLIVNCIKE